ncbi:hypothetical protein [Streptomyces sp. NPDC058664]|uniref:hypothetical protein n=1 Tax=unclassified Streptomyces TaxID=2593676 RepID=UPI003655D604
MARWKKRPTANHRLRADDCRRHPGMWIEVGVYNSRQSAESTGRHVRTADRLPYYTPVGAFETRTELVDDGTALYARYTGDAR